MKSDILEYLDFMASYDWYRASKLVEKMKSQDEDAIDGGLLREAAISLGRCEAFEEVAELLEMSAQLELYRRPAHSVAPRRSPEALKMITQENLKRYTVKHPLQSDFTPIP